MLAPGLDNEEDCRLVGIGRIASQSIKKMVKTRECAAGVWRAYLEIQTGPSEPVPLAYGGNKLWSRKAIEHRGTKSGTAQGKDQFAKKLQSLARL